MSPSLLAWALAFIGLVLAGLRCAPREGDVQPPAPRVIVENAAWTWFNDERAIFVGPRLYVGYVDTAGYSAVSVHTVGSDVEPQAFRLSSFKQVDDHNNPALLQLDGRVLAAYAQHHVEPFWYWRFAGGVSDSVSWSPEHRTRRLDAPTTYNNVFRLTEEDWRIYNFFRGTNFDPAYMTSEDGGQHWSAPHHLIRSGDSGTRPYVKYVSDGANRIAPCCGCAAATRRTRTTPPTSSAWSSKRRYARIELNSPSSTMIKSNRRDCPRLGVLGLAWARWPPDRSPSRAPGRTM